MQRLLYVTSAVPAVSGNGRAMRAAMVLEALREAFREILGKTGEVSVAMPGQCPPADVRYDVVHVFRLEGLALAKPYLEAAGRRHLDLDDIESKTHRRIEAICRANGHVELADREAAESRRCALLEVAAFRKFDRVYVCSEADREELADRCPAELVVLPNAVRLPEPPPSPPHRDSAEPFRFLFVGTLGYYPNFDACAWFLRNILPILRQIAPIPFLVEIAGSGSAERLKNQEFVRILGEVPSVGPLYEAADAAIVPIRAGGGTRIKILEAFSYRRPVVSTTIGAEGIAATPGVDILLGDTPEEFAARCVDLMRDRDLGRRLAENALRLVTSAYSVDALKRIVSLPPAAPVR